MPSISKVISPQFYILPEENNVNRNKKEKNEIGHVQKT